MGVFREFIRSIKKTKAMSNLIKFIQMPKNPLDFASYPKKENCDKAMKDFYNCIHDDYVLGVLIKEYEMTYENFEKIFDIFLALGYNYYDNKNNYLPVSIFAFKKPLLYILENMEVFITNNEKKDIKEICYNAKMILRDYN